MHILPTEPTEKIIDAILKAHDDMYIPGAGCAGIGNIYKAILDNAPCPWTELKDKQPRNYQVVIWECEAGIVKSGRYLGPPSIVLLIPASSESRTNYGEYTEVSTNDYTPIRWMPLPKGKENK